MLAHRIRTGCICRALPLLWLGNGNPELRSRPIETPTPLYESVLPRDSRRLAWGLGLGFSLVFLAILPPGIYSVDGNVMLGVAESLVTHHGFTVPQAMGEIGVGGRYYSHWYPLLSILAVPSAYLAQLASRITNLPFHYLAAILALPITALLTAATSSMVALLSLRFGANKRGAWLAGVSFTLGTVALAYGRTFYAEPLLAFLTVSGLYYAMGRSQRDVLLAACFAALAILAKPAGIFIGPILVAYLLVKRAPFFRSLLPLAGTAAGFAVYAGYNVLRFGHPLNFGISSPFRFTLLPGLTGLLASPGYGLFWYCPPLLLAFFGLQHAWNSKKFEALTVVVLFSAFLFLHSLLWYWYAAWSWGPRYLVPAIPGLCALLGLLEGKLRKALVVLTLLGFLVNAPTTFCFYERYYAELNDRAIPTDDSIAWSFRYAPVLHEWPAALRQVSDASKVDVREIFARRGSPSQTIKGSRALQVVALWWWVLPLAKIPRWIGALVSVVMIVWGFRIVLLE